MEHTPFNQEFNSLTNLQPLRLEYTKSAEVEHDAVEHRGPYIMSKKLPVSKHIWSHVHLFVFCMKRCRTCTVIHHCATRDYSRCLSFIKRFAEKTVSLCIIGPAGTVLDLLRQSTSLRGCPMWYSDETGRSEILSRDSRGIAVYLKSIHSLKYPQSPSHGSGQKHMNNHLMEQTETWSSKGPCHPFPRDMSHAVFVRLYPTKPTPFAHQHLEPSCKEWLGMTLSCMSDTPLRVAGGPKWTHR